MKTRTLHFIWITFFLTLASQLSYGVNTYSFTHAEYDDFVEGEFTNIGLHQTGILKLAPTMKMETELDPPIIWAVAHDARGNLFLGTGNQGKVLKISPLGEATILFSPEEVLSRAIAVDKNNKVYVGTSPGGRIYRISDDGSVEVFFDPPDDYIWELLFDEDGNLYAATGDKGRIYRIPSGFKPGDEAEIWYEVKQTHITSMTMDNTGNLVIGTSPDGMLYRITGPDEGTAIYNSNSQEIKNIVITADDIIYFSTYNLKSSKPAATSLLLGATTVTSTDEDNNNKSPVNSDYRKSTINGNGGGEGFGSLLALYPDGFVEPLWVINKANITSLYPRRNGSWLIGTSDEGRIYHFKERYDWGLLQQTTHGGEISAIIRNPNDREAILILASNPARIYNLKDRIKEGGVYISKVYDARQIADWGNLRPVSGDSSKPQAHFRTRTGNTDQPDDTWSKWEEVIFRNGDWSVTSPNARYFQYEITFLPQLEEAAEGSDIRQVRAFFQTRNTAPSISRINVVDEGFEVIRMPANSPNIDLQKFISEKNPERLLQDPSPREQLRKAGESGLLTVAWKAQDMNGDRLRYSLVLEGGESAQVIPIVDDTDDPIASIRVEGFSEGWYRARITASDWFDNDKDQALTTEAVSELFMIDHSAPEISILESTINEDGSALFEFQAEDKYSVVRAFYYAVDGGEFKALRPKDGLFDSQKEQFICRLDKLESGEHSLVLQVYDEKGRGATLPVPFKN